MNWFKERKKYIFLLEQDEEIQYSINKLECFKFNVGIVYTGDWDIEIKKWHEKRIDFIEMIYPHTSIIREFNKVDRTYIIEIKNNLKNGPIPLSIRELFSATYENMMPYHRRRWNKYVTYSENLDKLCLLHEYLIKIPKDMYPDVIVMPEKIGWMRKYISYFFYNSKIPLYAFMGLRYDEKYALEVCEKGKLRYYGKKGIEIFKQEIKNNNSYDVNEYEYRNKENIELGRNGKYIFIKKLLDHLVSIMGASKLYINNLLLLLIRKKITTDFNKSWNKYSVATNFYLNFIVGFWWFIVDYFLWKIDNESIFKNNRKFIILPLQHYPETSTVGEFSYAQTEIQIFEQLLNLYDDIEKILIVEHPTTMFSGERARWIRDFYKNTKGVEFCSLLAPTGIPFDILRKAEAVISIIGGISIENALIGGKSFICILHPMLYVENIKLLNISTNKRLERYLDMGKINITAKEYCELTKEHGLNKNELLYFVKEEIIFK
jgi:hypothetical protein